MKGEERIKINIDNYEHFGFKYKFKFLDDFAAKATREELAKMIVDIFFSHHTRYEKLIDIHYICEKVIENEKAIYHKTENKSMKINGFVSLKDWCEYSELHYLPLLDKLTEQDSVITDKDDKWLLTLLFNDLTSIVNNREVK